MTGDLLEQQVDAIVNTVNCVGVMGKGIALQFARRSPENLKAYQHASKEGMVRVGHMFVFDAGPLAQPHFIINFPTKDHWRARSKMSYIDDGLQDLVQQIRALGIRSIAIPPLGCGNGGLDWNEVRPRIESAFADLDDIDVRLFEPAGAPPPQKMIAHTSRPKMTRGRAALVKLMAAYSELDYSLSKIEVQKLGYFLHVAGVLPDLGYVKGKFGPYSDQLRHVLERMESHYIQGLGDHDSPAEIRPLPEALSDADAFLSSSDESEHRAKIESLAELISGYQTPYGMELLATVHWVARNDAHAKSADEAITAVHAWNDRKARVMRPEHIRSAWNHLASQGWI